MNNKWTIEQLRNTDDLTFTISILNERLNKLNRYSPLAEKLQKSIRTIETIMENQHRE